MENSILYHQKIKKNKIKINKKKWIKDTEKKSFTMTKIL